MFPGEFNVSPITHLRGGKPARTVPGCCLERRRILAIKRRSCGIVAKVGADRVHGSAIERALVADQADLARRLGDTSARISQFLLCYCLRQIFRSRCCGSMRWMGLSRWRSGRFGRWFGLGGGASSGWCEGGCRRRRAGVASRLLLRTCRLPLIRSTMPGATSPARVPENVELSVDVRIQVGHLH